MTFRFLYSAHSQPPVSIPQIRLNLCVRVPPASTSGTLASIETANAPGFGPPLHQHPQMEIFYVPGLHALAVCTSLGEAMRNGTPDPDTLNTFEGLERGIPSAAIEGRRAMMRYQSR